MDSRSRHLSHDDYTVACICPIGVELMAVEGMLDEIHDSLPSSRDQNGYTLGRIGGHNVVAAVIPAIGNNGAASVAMQLLNDFRSIRLGLLVGIIRRGKLFSSVEAIYGQYLPELVDGPESSYFVKFPQAEAALVSNVIYSWLQSPVLPDLKHTTVLY
jgi:hypothetical protein